MVMSVTNCKAVIPFVPVVERQIPSLDITIPRGETSHTVLVSEANPITSIILPFTPHHIKLVSVFVDGFRVVNASLNFEDTFTSFELLDNVLTFNEPIWGNIEIISDSPWLYTLPSDFYINVDNVQGARGKALANQTLAGLFCEPLVLTQPLHGYVRITDDRHDLVYVPNSGFNGYDAFSYAVLTDRGQMSEPKCVFLTIGTPPESTPT